MKETTQESGIESRSLKVEDILPVKAAGIECLKESNPEMMSPHRYLHKWFARRPTAATRLAILASVLPDTVSNEELLKLMGIAPKNTEHLNIDLSEYVIEKYRTKDKRKGSLEDHFGYPLLHQQTLDNDELERLHETIKETWGGELPTVIDPTAGGGTIPMESLRYGFPTISNELNPVAWLINKVILEFAPKVGSVEEEVHEWGIKINEYAKDELDDFFPSNSSGQTPTDYVCTYSFECSSCGHRTPVSDRWWITKESSTEGQAVRPHLTENEIKYEYVRLPDDVSTDEFDPDIGAVDRGDVECLNCGVVTEKKDIKEIFSSGNYEIEVCAVKYQDEKGNSGYRAAEESDKEAIERAIDKVENDLNLRTLLNIDRDVGDTENLRFSWSYRYGMEKWRDTYTARQLMSHAAYANAFNDYKEDIESQYDETQAEAILVLLALAGSKIINRNSRMNPWYPRRGCPSWMMGNNNLAFQWQFAETNPTIGAVSYLSSLNNILEKYEELVGYLSPRSETPVDVQNGDAADLPYEDDTIGVVVIDPPYGDNIRYGELSDVFYVWLREYLKDIYPDQFSSPSTNKQEEAIEDRSRVSRLEGVSKDEAARKRYEDKMSEIFSEIYRVMEPGGVLTIYFTEKETSAWDSLTTSLIESEFTVTATHTITSEMPQRVSMREVASADSTLLLTCRKPQETDQKQTRQPTLWDDIHDQTQKIARKKATELLDSDLNLTKTDVIIGAFGPTLRVFTSNYPVVDVKDNLVRPKKALETTRTAVTEVLVERELGENLDELDGLTTWYILSWLVYQRNTIPYDDANQLAKGVGVDIDSLKRDTKIWSKSKSKLILKGQDYRVRDYDKLEAGEKRRKRAFPVDPRSQSFDYHIDAVHSVLNIIENKGGDFTWNWISERDLQNKAGFVQTVRSLLQVLPKSHEDYDSLVTLVSGETGELLDIDTSSFSRNNRTDEQGRTTLSDF